VSDTTRKQYPSSIPFLPPQDLSAREARLRRWTYGLAAGCALFLVLVVAAEVFFIKSWNQYAQDGTEVPGPGAPSARRRGGAARAQSPRRSTVVKGSAADAIAPQRELFLQTSALVTAAHLYQSYLNITLLADSVEHGVYKKAVAGRMLVEVGNTLNVVDRQLARLQVSGLDPEDRKDVAAVRKLSSQLRDQARELQAYWDSPTPAQARKYQQARQATWAGLKPLLGIDGKE
jgi:hypothetical protein